MKNGKGILTTIDGIIKKGNWKDDKFIEDTIDLAKTVEI